MTGQSQEAFRTIGEVADNLDLPAHVLRFWETRFKEIEPVKRAGGRRYYRQRDVELVAAIRHLLYGEGYTIKGVQRILKEQGARAVIDSVRGGTPPEPPRPEPENLAPPAAMYHAPDIAPARAAPAQPPLPELVAAPAPNAPEAGPRALDHEDARRLRAALKEIAECKRLLTLTRR